MSKRDGDEFAAPTGKRHTTLCWASSSALRTRVQWMILECAKFEALLATVDCVELPSSELHDLQQHVSRCHTLVTDPARVAMTAQVPRLPTELWGIIIPLIAGDQRDLSYIRSTCRAFRRLANQHTPKIVVRCVDLQPAIAFATFPLARRLVVVIVSKEMDTGSRAHVAALEKLDGLWKLFQETRPHALPGSLVLELGCETRNFTPKNESFLVRVPRLEMKGHSFVGANPRLGLWYDHEVVLVDAGEVDAHTCIVSGAEPARRVCSRRTWELSKLVEMMATARAFSTTLNAENTFDEPIDDSTTFNNLCAELVHFHVECRVKLRRPTTWLAWLDPLLDCNRWEGPMPSQCEVHIWMPTIPWLYRQILGCLRRINDSAKPLNNSGHPATQFAIYIHERQRETTPEYASSIIKLENMTITSDNLYSWIDNREPRVTNGSWNQAQLVAYHNYKRATKAI